MTFPAGSDLGVGKERYPSARSNGRCGWSADGALSKISWRNGWTGVP